MTVKLLALGVVWVAAGALVTAGAISLASGASPPIRTGVGQKIVVELTRTGTSHVTFGDLTVRAGVPVRVTVINKSGIAHDFTAPELGINQIIPAGIGGVSKTTTFTFTADRPGVFDWNCVVPCGEYMGGHVHVLVGSAGLRGIYW